MMILVVALVAALLVVTESQESDRATSSNLKGFLSKYMEGFSASFSGADASKISLGSYNKVIFPSLNPMKHVNGPDELLYQNDLLEHGLGGSAASHTADRTSLMLDDNLLAQAQKLMPKVITKDHETLRVTDKKTEPSEFEKMLASQKANIDTGLMAIGMTLIAFATVLAVRFRREWQPDLVFATEAGHESAIHLPALDDTTSTRRRLILSSSVTAATLWPLSAPAADTPAESLRKSASGIPGLGPPDVLFPSAVFKGRWRVKRTVAGRTEPMGSAAAAAAGLLATVPEAESYETRFLDYGDGEHVVIDRAFEAESRSKAGAYGAGFQSANAKWEPSNPNVCTLETATGALLELKVTKRSFETPGPGGFGSSEYSRVAVAQGGVAAVPQILARRLQTRYRWESDASVIEALEIENVYDPQATGFADLNGAQPVFVVKSRITLERLGGGSK